MNKHLGEKCSNEKEIDGGDETLNCCIGNGKYEAQIIFPSDVVPGKSWLDIPLSLSLFPQSFILVTVPRALFSYFSMDLNESGAEGRLRYCFSCRTLYGRHKRPGKFPRPQEAWDRPHNCHPIHPHLRKELSN